MAEIEFHLFVDGKEYGIRHEFEMSDDKGFAEGLEACSEAIHVRREVLNHGIDGSFFRKIRSLLSPDFSDDEIRKLCERAK